MQHSIMLVDDEPHILDALKTGLRNNPYEILTATSGMQGMEILSRHRVDVILSDEQMPGISGSEFLGQVRKKYPDTVRIILTGQAKLEAAIRAINEGEVYRFLTKPCNMAELSITIHQALQMKDLAWESAKLLTKARKQQALLEKLEKESPGILQVKHDPGEVITFEDEGVDIDNLLDEIRCELALPGSEYLELAHEIDDSTPLPGD